MSRGSLRAGEPAQGLEGIAHTTAGKLFICGGGRLPDELRRRFIDMAGGPQARIVVITTASPYADTDRMEPKLALWREQSLADLTFLHTRSRVTADEAQFVRPLTLATGVWFVGGDQNWLIDTYLGTSTEREIHGVLARGGVVGGTSAGAAIMSPVMIRRDRPTLQFGPGFGFLQGTVVDQHFLKRKRQERLLRVLGGHPGLLGLGIDEGTALLVDGSHLFVYGESQVMVCSPPAADLPADVYSLDPGAEADLPQLRAHALARIEPKPAEPADDHVAAAPADEDSPDADPADSSSTVGVTADDVGAAQPTVEKVGH
ncbi:MAG TPA: cyanophycinase [Pirellulales bacterium]|nr:cyanophycinase [Pirellulales bacterium]